MTMMSSVRVHIVDLVATPERAAGRRCRRGALDAHYESAEGLFHKGEYMQAAIEVERAFELEGAGTSNARVRFLESNIYESV